ncbi:hypothetical protein ACXR0O_01095 [Verrucomicrobiota bacterium sgz303538]
MKKIPIPVLLAFVALSLEPTFAQSKATPSPKPAKERKTMIFQPGAKTPDATPAPTEDVPVATPAPAPTAAAAAAAPATAPQAGVDEPGQAAASFFALLQKGQIDEAYLNLTRGSKIGERPEELQTLKSKTTEALQVFGAIQGYELLETKAVGTNLMRRTYLSLGKDFPLRWRFYFYRTGAHWRLVDLRVDDRLGGMFDEQDEPRGPEQKAP